MNLAATLAFMYAMSLSTVAHAQEPSSRRGAHRQHADAMATGKLGARCLLLCLGDVTEADQPPLATISSFTMRLCQAWGAMMPVVRISLGRAALTLRLMPSIERPASCFS